MKINTIARYLLAIGVVGVPSFIKFDTTGVTHDFGLINAHSLTIIVVTAVLTLLFFCLISMRPVQRSNPDSVPNSGWAWVLFYYYGVYLIFSAMVLPFQGFAVAGYRVAQWIILISLCWYYFYTCRKSESESSTIGEDFISVLRLTTSIPALIILIGLVLFPDLAYTYSLETNTFRLGGYLYHPNRMGTICGIGSILFWVSPKRKTDRLWSIILFVMMIFTYSRGAMVGFVLYVLYHNFKLSTSIRKLSVSFILLIVLTLTFATKDSYLSKSFLSFFARGEGTETIYSLNSRNRIWNLSLESISESPWIGKGYIQGPKTLSSTLLDGSWATSHAHNDILNAGVSGGVFMAVFTLLIYIFLTFSTLRREMPYKTKAIAETVLIQCGIYSILTPLFSTSAENPGTLLLILIGFVYSYPQKHQSYIQFNPSHANLTTS